MVKFADFEVNTILCGRILKELERPDSDKFPLVCSAGDIVFNAETAVSSIHVRDITKPESEGAISLFHPSNLGEYHERSPDYDYGKKTNTRIHIVRDGGKIGIRYGNRKSPSGGWYSDIEHQLILKKAWIVKP